MKLFFGFVLLGLTYAICSDSCLGECVLTQTFEACQVSCGCAPLPNVTAAPSNSSQQTTPIAQTQTQENPEVPQPLDFQSPAVQSNPPVSSVDEQFKEQYRARACGFQCVALCEKLQSIDCIDHCEAMFCKGTQAYTFDQLTLAYESKPLTSSLLGNAFVIFAVVYLIYWGKRRLFKVKQLSKRLVRKVNTAEPDTYYRL